MGLDAASSPYVAMRNIKVAVGRSFTCPYFVLRDRNGKFLAVRDGFAVGPFACALLCLGWLWAFANDCLVFGWQIIGITAAGSLVAPFLRYTYQPKEYATVLALSWFAFAFTVAHIANSRRVSALVGKGFELLSSDIVATNSKNAILTFLKEGTPDQRAPSNTLSTLSISGAGEGTFMKTLLRFASVAFTILFFVGLGAFLIYFFVQNTPQIRVELLSIQGVQVFKVTNVGNSPVEILNAQINDRAECKPVLVSALAIPTPFQRTALAVGDAATMTSTCFGTAIVRVTVETDHGTGTYTWK